MHSRRFVTPALAVAILLGGCAPGTTAVRESPEAGAFVSVGVSAVLPSSSTSATMDALVTSIQERKAAEEEAARLAAQRKAALSAKADVVAPVSANHASRVRRVVKKGKHQLTEAEKATAMRDAALRRIKSYGTPTIP